MKIRSGFVSNSSSSSFIVLSDGYSESNKDEFRRIFEKYLDDYTNNFNYNPTTEFGWEFKKYSSIEEKFDWCCLALFNLTYYNTHLYETYYSIFYNVIKSIFHEMNEFNFCSDNAEGYIDHQSLEFESNYAMFNTRDNLENFLFGNSVIYGGNDNDNLYWDDDGNLKEHQYW